MTVKQPEREEVRSDRKASSAEVAPLIVDLGKHTRRRIKKLRGGTGALLSDVTEVLDELRRGGKLEASVQPIIVVVREKRKGAKGVLPMFKL